MLNRVGRTAYTVSLVAGLSGVSWVLGYAAGRLWTGAPDAPVWVQAASSLCVLVLAGVQVWATTRNTSGRAP